MSTTIKCVTLRNQLDDNVHNAKTIKSLFNSAYNWYLSSGMLAILFTVQIQHIWFKMHNDMLLLQ